MSRETKRLVKRRHKKGRKKHLIDSMHRVHRRGQRFIFSCWRSFANWAIIAGVGLVLLLMGLFIFSPILEVREVQITRVNARLDVEKVQQALAPIFDRHLFFLPGYEVVQMVKDAVPDVRDVEVYKYYPSRLSVKVALDPLYARLNILEPEMAGEPTGTGAFVDFLTAQGNYVFASFSEGQEALPIIHLVDWGVRPEVGAKLVTPEFLHTMQEAEQMLQDQFGQKIVGRTIFLRAQEYHLRTDGGIGLWFDTHSTIDRQMSRYRSFLRNVDSNTVKEYIDLRLTDRVIYK